jgi:hypothetical protein
MKPKPVAPFVDQRPPNPNAAEVCLGEADYTPAEARPESSDPLWTGRYQEQLGKFTFHVNQASTRLHIWISKVSNARDRELVAWMGQVLERPANARRQPYKLVGLREEDEPGASFALSVETPEQAYVGVLRATARVGILELELIHPGTSQSENLTYTLLMRSAAPSLSLTGILATKPESRPLVEAVELHPLTRQHTDYLTERLDKTNLLDRYLAPVFAPDAAPATRAAATEALDDYLGEVLAWSGGASRNGGNIYDDLLWSADDILLARRFAHALLLGRSARFTLEDNDEAEPVSLRYIEWLERALQLHEAFRAGSGNTVKHMRAHLGLRGGSSAEGGLFEYEAMLEVRGPSAGVGPIGGTVWEGSLELECKATDDLEGWKDTFLVSIAGYTTSVGMGMLQSFRSGGTARSRVRWTPDDVPGDLDFFDLGVDFAILIGGTYGGTFLTLEGSGVLPPLRLDLSGFAMAMGASLGVGVTDGRGIILKASRADPDPDRPPMIPLRPNDVPVEEALSTTLAHFRLGRGGLTRLGRDRIREFCAEHLRLLSLANSELVIVGHADRKDCDRNNLQLSEVRAQNVRTAFQDILGTDLAVGSVVAVGRGEAEARFFGFEDRVPNPFQRRVDVYLNGSLSLTLRGRPPRER